MQSGPGNQADAVGAIGKSDQTFEVVEAVDASSDHPKRQVDLGTRVLNEHRRSTFDQPPLPSSFFLSAEAAEDVSSGSPFSILASIFGRSSGSGFRSRACAHWNLASSVRPTRQ